MDLLNSVIDAIAVISAHVLVGLFSAPLKYRRGISVLIWCVWGVLQTVMLSPVMASEVDIVFGFIAGFIVPYIGQYVLFFITTRGNPARRLFTLLTYSVFFCIYMGVANALIGSIPNLHWTTASLVRITLLFIVVLIFIKRIAPLFWNSLADSIKSWLILIFADTVFLLAVVSSSVFPNRVESVKDPYFIAFLTLVVAIISVYPILFISIKNMALAEREKRSNMQNELLLSQVTAQAKEVETARQTRHDMRQHYGMLLSYAKSGESEKLIRYIEEQTERIDNMRQLTYCENDAVNNILSVYANKAAVSSIAFEVKASVKKELRASASDLVTIIGNLLENAIHGARDSKVQDARIFIEIYHKDRRLVVNCKNSCKKSLVFDEMPDTLGSIGIKSIRTTAERYNGICRFMAGGGEFKALIVMDE